MEANNFRFYEFGEFVLDSRRRVLLKNGKEIPLKPRQFELLFVLVQNEGRLLEHDELLERVWEGLFVEQSSLKKGISALRRILEEKPNESFYIKTVPRRGYSFVAPVKPLADNGNLVVERVSVTEIEEIEEEIIFDENEDSTNEKAVRALPAAPRGSKRLWLAASAGLILMAAAALIGWKYISKNAPAIDFSRMQIAPLTTSGNSSVLKTSRNGEYLLYGTIERGLFSVSVKHLPTGKNVPLLPPQKVRVYAGNFAPDNQAVYLWMYYESEPSRSGIYKIALEGGEPQKISDKQTALEFSPDGRRIAYRLNNVNEKSESGIFTANADFSDEKLIYVFNPTDRFVQSHDWSPDGRFITFAGRLMQNNRKKYFISNVPAEGGEERYIVPPRDEHIFSAFWFPDGAGLSVTANDANTQLNQIWYLSYPGGEWRRVTNDLTYYWTAPPTADGKSIVVTQTRTISNLWVGAGDGQNFRQVTFDTIGYEVEMGWLDDETILFSAFTDGNFNIWAMSADGVNRRQLTFDPKTDSAPQAAPGGKRIFFLSNRSGMRQVWQMDADGGNARQITNSPVEVHHFKILPDGQTIVYEVWLPAQEAVLFKKASDGGEIRQLPIPAPYEWDISPDGRSIAYAAQTANGMKVRISPLEENRTLKEFDFGDFDKLVWTADGKALLYDSQVESGEITIQPVEGGAPRQITNFNAGENIWNFALSPGGKRIVARRVKQYTDVMQLRF